MILVVGGFKPLDAPDCVGCSTGARPAGKPNPAPGHIGSMGLPNIELAARPMLARELRVGVGTGGVVLLRLALGTVAASEEDTHV